jgi:hypothetical protein
VSILFLGLYGIIVAAAPSAADAAVIMSVYERMSTSFRILYVLAFCASKTKMYAFGIYIDAFVLA